MSRASIELQQVINESVRERLSVLSASTVDELAQLPSHSSEVITAKGNKFILSIWHDVLPSQEHRIVVQAYRPGILGIGRMQAEGFAINSRNEKRALTLDEWAPFT